MITSSALQRVWHAQRPVESRCRRCCCSGNYRRPQRNASRAWENLLGHRTRSLQPVLVRKTSRPIVPPHIGAKSNSSVHRQTRAATNLLRYCPLECSADAHENLLPCLQTSAQPTTASATNQHARELLRRGAQMRQKTRGDAAGEFCGRKFPRPEST